MNPCTHQWSMCHVRHGYVVVEGCFECGGRLSFFSEEPLPPVDEHRDGQHFWSYLGSSQTVKFDLHCCKCGTTVNLGDVNGIMFSECQDPDCAVGALLAGQGGRALVYVALCPDSTHARGRCVSHDGVAALTEYFNQDLGPRDRKIVVVPCKQCNSIDRCRGTVIADVGLTDIQ